MVRPIEISDSMTKAEAVQRVQQNQKVQPEAAQHYQKTNTERLTEQVTTPNPVTQGDEVVLRANEEEEKRKVRRENRDESREHGSEPHGESGKDNDDDEEHPRDHIDIRI